MSNSSPAQLVEAFWAAMATNNFDAPAALMDHAFVIAWPQSNERIRAVSAPNASLHHAG